MLLTFHIQLRYLLATVSLSSEPDRFHNNHWPKKKKIFNKNGCKNVLTCCLFGFDSVSMSLRTTLLNREREFPSRATALHRNTRPRRHCPAVAVSVSPLLFLRFPIRASVVYQCVKGWVHFVVDGDIFFFLRNDFEQFSCYRSLQNVFYFSSFAMWRIYSKYKNSGNSDFSVFLQLFLITYDHHLRGDVTFPLFLQNA